MIPVGGLVVGWPYGRWEVGWIVGLLKWLRDDKVKPCVSISSSGKIMRFLDNKILDWCALDGFESGVVPFSFELERDQRTKVRGCSLLG